MRRQFLCGSCLLLCLAGSQALAQLPGRGGIAPTGVRRYLDTSQVPRQAPPDNGGSKAPPFDQGDRPDGDGRRDRDRDQGHGHDHHHGHHHHHGRWPWVWLPPVFVSPFPTNYFGYNLPGAYDPAPYYVPPQQPTVSLPAPSDPPPANVRSSNAEQRSRAGKFLQYGDDNFGKQKYLAAIGRYKTALEAAPDLPDAYLRQGFAYVALGQLENAARVFRRGLTAPVDWRSSTVKLNGLYGAGAVAKEQHLENLAKAVEDNPLDSDLLLVLGLELYFDDQRDRAQLCFSRITQLGGIPLEQLGNVLPQPADAVNPVGKPGKIAF